MSKESMAEASEAFDNTRFNRLKLFPKLINKIWETTWKDELDPLLTSGLCKDTDMLPCSIMVKDLRLLIMATNYHLKDWHYSIKYPEELIQEEIKPLKDFKL